MSIPYDLRHDDLSVYLNIVMSKNQVLVAINEGTNEYSWKTACLFFTDFDHYILKPTHLPSEF